MTEAILDVRLSRACDYLREGLSVSAVANFCGWKSDITFRKAFKARFGIRPKDLNKGNQALGSSLCDAGTRATSASASSPSVLRPLAQD